MDDDDDWSVVDSLVSDLEVEFQIDFVSWLQSHDLSDFSEHPLLNFDSKQLQIGLCGLFWQLRTSWRSSARRNFTGNGEKLLDHRPLFAIERVHRIVGEEIGHELSESHGHEVLAIGGDWKEDPFEIVEIQSAPELGRQIRCKGFICTQAVEVAESFVDVLDALFEFSDWYAHAQSDAQQVIEDDGFDWQIEEARMNSLKLHAKEASMICKIAREAMQEASKAAANLLDELLQQILIAQLQQRSISRLIDSVHHRGKERAKKSVHFGENKKASDSTGSVQANLREIGVAAAKLWRTEAIHDGFVLQWCTIDNMDDPSCIDCKLDMGELFLHRCEVEAVQWVGINIDQPLRIVIDISSGSAKVIHDHNSLSGLEKRSQKGTLGTTFVMEMVSKQLQKFWNGGWALDTKNTENVAYRGLETVDRNVFVRILEKAARYVMDLSSSICAVCGQARWDEGEFRDTLSGPAPCRRALCQAIFEKWAGMETTSAYIPTAVAQKGCGSSVEVQDDPPLSPRSLFPHPPLSYENWPDDFFSEQAVPPVFSDDPFELWTRALHYPEATAGEGASLAATQSDHRRCLPSCRPT